MDESIEGVELEFPDVNDIFNMEVFITPHEGTYKRNHALKKNYNHISWHQLLQWGRKGISSLGIRYIVLMCLEVPSLALDSWICPLLSAV